MVDSVPIPGPRGLPFVGNLTDIDPELPIASLWNLSKQYGEIFTTTIFGRRSVFVCSQRLMNEICNEKRFGKEIKAGLAELRNGVHDGLFTAHNEEENWAIAHRTLVPAFGPLNINNMFDDMKDIASQLVLKWARYGPSYVIPAADDFTRLTLDTLALCAMDYRFNSFYAEEMHPFVLAMTGFLKTGGSRARRPAYLAPFYRTEDAQFYKDIEYMRKLSGDIVTERVEHPNDTKDLLNAMVLGTDPKTGKHLTHESIINNMITFLIAGHETTSGLLSFLFYYLLKSPEAYRKAQAEVDEVIGRGSIEVHHMNELPYVTACLREASRLQPTAPAFTVGTKSPQGDVIGGKYHVKSGDGIVALLHMVHRDPAVYGDDADDFKPERMLEENFKKLPPNSWKTFGNGSRGCIGRPFAWQEAMLVTAIVLQYFDFTPNDASYDLQIKSTLTIKPKDFFMRASLREGWTATKVEQSLSGSIRSSGPAKATPVPSQTAGGTNKPITVLYGSNSGTCESFAQTLAVDAAAHGFIAKVDTLDSAKQNIPTDQPVVVITASYEGQPCDNAAFFYDWLLNLKNDEKIETSFAVYGCGHSDWKSTFHRIPNSIDELLEKHGGNRICSRGSADAAKGDMLSAFQSWEDESFWPALKKQFGGQDADLPSEATALGESLTVEVSNKRASHLRADVAEAKVVSAKTLTAPGVPEKRHIELQLPSELTYRSGDYLAVLPLNAAATVHRVALRFGLPWDAMLTISSKTSTTLPTGYPISAHNLFSAYVELSQPATKRNIALLVEASKNEATKAELNRLADGDFSAEVTEKRVSLLDLLERFPDVELPLSAFVASLISMRIRQYSISSSPLSNPNNVTLTYAVLDEEALGGGGKRHIGVASNYLSHLKAGDIVHVAVKASNQAFHLPADAETVPVIMVAAGTGLAPFRGFVQERAAMTAAGRKLAPAHLYVGCRQPDKDELYREEFSFWESQGAVTIHHAFSQAPEQSDGHKHVDEAMLADTDLLIKLWDEGARVYVCGSRQLGESVKQACLKMSKEWQGRNGLEPSDEVAQKWFYKIRNERFATDVFQ